MKITLSSTKNCTTCKSYCENNELWGCDSQPSFAWADRYEDDPNMLVCDKYDTYMDDEENKRFDKYEHHGTEVWVRRELKGRHTSKIMDYLWSPL